MACASAFRPRNSKRKRKGAHPEIPGEPHFLAATLFPVKVAARE